MRKQDGENISCNEKDVRWTREVKVRFLHEKHTVNLTLFVRFSSKKVFQKILSWFSYPYCNMFSAIPRHRPLVVSHGFQHQSEIWVGD